MANPVALSPVKFKDGTESFVVVNNDGAVWMYMLDEDNWHRLEPVPDTQAFHQYGKKTPND
jgi:hypothetical protein